MSKFEAELEKGNFVIGECPDCKMVIWPPSDSCSKCFGNLKWRKSSETGKLIEFSKKENTNFCIAEFEGKIRIMGKLKVGTGKPEIGKNVKLESCNFDDGHYNFAMTLV